jgi:hypothetical protein
MSTMSSKRLDGPRATTTTTSDVSIVGLAVAATARAVDARYAAAKATLSSMTGDWEDGTPTRRGNNRASGNEKKKNGRGMTPEDVRVDAVRKAVSHERRMAASAARGGSSSSSSTTSSSSSPSSASAGEALRSKANGFFFSEVRAGVDELSRETSKAKAEARSSANRGNAKATTAAVVKKSKEDARAASDNDKKKKRAEPAKTKPKVEKKKPAEKKKQSRQPPQRRASKSDAGDDDDDDEDGSPMGVVVELAKFALPALLTWLINRKKIKELNGKLDSMTQAKVRAALEATKLRQEVVELRHDLDLAEREAEDIQKASEQFMQRRNSVKEVKMKHMAVDHNDQMRKVREDAQKEINEAKALEVGARWREEACRRMKNRAVAEAEELRKKIEELEAKIKRIEDTQREERVEAVKNTVQNAAKSFVRMASKIARKEEPKVEAPAAPAPEPAPEPEEPVAGGKKKKGKKKNKQ